MDGSEYQELRRKCFDEFDAWSAIGAHVAQRLKEELKRAGIESDISSRSKDPDSLLRKMVFKYQSADLSRVGDRAGVRVVVYLPDDKAPVRQLIKDAYPRHRIEDLSDRYGADRFGYRGIHVDVTLDAVPLGIGPFTGAPACEIQLRSAAEHAWSVVSHLLTYKTPAEGSVPVGLQRRLNRLIALVELFDEEVESTKEDIFTMPEYSAQKLMFDLDRLHAATVGDLLPTLYRADDELIRNLVGLYTSAERPSEQLKVFVDQHRERVRAVVGTFDSSVSPLVNQPESFLIWERLEHDPVDVAQRWVQTSYPQQILIDLAILWGVDLPES